MKISETWHQKQHNIVLDDFIGDITINGDVDDTVHCILQQGHLAHGKL